MNASMGSIRHWVRSAKPPPDDLGYDPGKDMVLSWSEINLFVDLRIDPEGPENVGNVSQTAVADGTELPRTDPEDDATNDLGTTRELRSLQHDTEPIRDLLANHQIYEKDCNHDLLENQKNKDIHSDNEPSSERGGEGEAAAASDRNCTQCAWPDWGEPLPPEDADDDINVDDAADGKKSPTLKKVVTFSDVVMVVEPSGLQEERETDSFSYAGSSDEELEHAADQVTISSSDKESLNSADVSAASHLLELGNELNHGDSQPLEMDSWVGVCRKRKCDDYDPVTDLERLSELIEKIYAAVPQLSVVTSSQGGVSSREVGSWTIEVSKDSSRISLKKITRQKAAEFEGLGCAGLEDVNEVLERPPSKRLYKLLNGFS